jgi:hypothetical protein
MSKRLAPLDMMKNELRNFVLHLLGTAPSSPVEGQQYHDTSTHHPNYYDGTGWNDLTNAKQLQGASLAQVRDLSQTTGQRDHLAISDFDTQVRTSRLDQMAAPTAAVSMNTQRLTGVADPTGVQDAATKNYVDSQVAGARDPKDDVQWATAAALAAYTRSGNVLTASANGSLSLDGNTPSAGDRVLVNNTGTATGADRGIYTVTQVGDSTHPWILTRASDADSSTKVTNGLFVWVTEGSALAKTGWLLTTPDPITLNTTALSFGEVAALTDVVAGAGLTKTGNQLDIGAGNGILVNADTIQVDPAVVARKYSATIGNGSLTSITITQATHGLAASSQNLVQVTDASTGEVVYPDLTVATNGDVTIAFAAAPANNAYRVTIIG